MSSDKEVNIYNMALHECITIDSLKLPDRIVRVTRVPGGWLYRTTITSGTTCMTEVFVPYSDEYVSTVRSIERLPAFFS